MGARIAYNNFTGGEVSPTLNAMGIYMHVRDEKPAGTAGGAYSTAATWQLRDLNKVLFNSIPGAELVTTVGGSTIKLPAGRYRIFATVPAYALKGCKAVIRDFMQGTDFMYSQSDYCDPSYNVYAHMHIRGVLTLPAATRVGIYMWAQVTYVSGLGAPSGSSGIPEVYTEIELWKI